MSKVLTFSRTFPSYHPRKGEPTYFVEKIWNSICWDEGVQREEFPIPYHLGIDFRNTDDKKHHTIRAGHRFKAGDWFSPRVWSGKPYNSKQIIIAPDIQVKKTWDFYKDEYKWLIPGDTTLNEIAENDGLSIVDFMDWFYIGKGKSFDGQIICWNENINY
jgi:hypothetical protein